MVVIALCFDFVCKNVNLFEKVANVDISRVLELEVLLWVGQYD